MNKRLIIRIFTIVTTIILSVCSLSACGLDLSGLLGGKPSSDQDITDKEYFQRIIQDNELQSQRAVNCSDVKNSKKPLKTSYYDDLGYYYYVYYLGTIEDFIIHNYYSFQYTADRQILKNFSVTISQATTEQVKKLYTNTVSKSISSSVSVSISRSIDATVGIDSFSMSNTVSAACLATWGANLTETQNNSYEHMTNQSNETVREFELDYNMCVDNYYYCYATCTDVDVYVAVMRDPNSNKAEYNYFTSIAPSSVISEKVFVSDKNDFLDLKGQFSTIFSGEHFNLSDKPSDHKSNFSEIVESFSRAEEYTVGILCKKKIHISLTKDNGDGRTTAQKYADDGYRMVKIEVSFYYTKGKEGRMRLTISPTESGAGAYTDEILDGAPGMKNYIVNVPLKDFCYRGDIWLNFRNQHMIYSYTISLIHINITYYY